MSDARGTIEIPEAVAKVDHTPFPEIDAVVERVAANAKRWVDVTVDERIQLLQQMQHTTLEIAADWAKAGADAKGIPQDDPNAGEDWMNGPTLLIRQLKLLEEALVGVRDHGAPPVPGKVKTLENGQLAVPAYPMNLVDRALTPMVTAEVWLQPGEAEVRQASIYQPGNKDEGGVCLVLGAGNVSSIPPTDAISLLFNEDRVVVLKMNPVNEYIGPHLEQALRPLVDAGYLGFVYGGAAEGKHVGAHEAIDQIHITGSDKTYEAIVFGPGEEGQKRKAANDPIWTKPISSELGNVTPIIVVPGPWSPSDLEFQGRNIAGMLTNNAGFNCIAGRVLVTHRSWSKRQALTDEVKNVLRDARPRHPYYPGARDRWEAFVTEHPDADTFGPDGPGCVPWTFLNNLDASDTNAMAFTTESFNGIMGEAALDVEQDVPAFLDAAVDFANDTLWGTLGCVVLVHPKTLKDPENAAAFERAVERLQYGTVAVNIWCAFGFAYMSSTWGAFPGHTPQDIQSGTGVVHNTLMLDHPQKTVIRAPFRLPVKNLSDPTHRTLHKVGPLLPSTVGMGDMKDVPKLLYWGLRA